MEASGLKKTLTALVDIRQGELRQALPVALAYGLVMASLYVLKPVRNALFLNRLGIGQLPYVLLLVAVVGGISASVYAWFARSVRIERLIIGTFLVLMASLLLFRVALPHGRPWLFYAFYIWVNLYGLMAASQLWLLAGAVFNPRAAKRLYGFIGTGGIAGAIFGGIFTGHAVRIVGTENLLLFCVGFLTLCLVLIRMVRPVDVEERGSRERKEPSGGTVALVARSRLIRLFGGMAALAAIVATFADIQFNDIANRAFPAQDAKTAFFGNFFAYLNVFAFAFQLVLTPRILRSFGVGVALLFLPLGLAVGSFAVLLSPALWSGVLLKVGDGGFRHSVHRSATELLFLPVPLDLKKRAKVFLDTTVDNLATGAGAALTLLLIGPLGVSYRYLSLPSLVLLVVWVVMAVRIREVYVDVFRTALRRRSLDIHQQTVGISDAEAIRVILEALESPDEREVRYALDLSETVQHVNLTQYLVRLLQHSSEAVRTQALRMLLASGDNSALPQVKRLLNDTSIEVRAEAVHYICLYDELPPMEQMGHFLHDPDDYTRAAAVACLAIHHGDTATLSIARQTLEVMLTGEQGGEMAKVAAAKTLAIIQDASLHHHFFSLLDDESPSVVIQAIQSAGEVRSPDLIPALARKLEDRRFRTSATRALAGYGVVALQPLRSLLRDGMIALDLKKGIARVLGLIEAQASVDLLFEHLDHADASMRYEVLRALNRLRAGDTPLRFHESRVRVALTREIQDYHETLQALYICCPAWGSSEGDVDLLGNVLEERLGHALERIFRLLGLLYPYRDIQSAHIALTSQRMDLRPSALEFLDNLLTPDDRQMVVPLVDDLPIEDKLRHDGALHDGQGRGDLLLNLIRGDDTWLRVCALYTAGQRRVSSLLSHVEAAQDDEDALVREAAALALRQLGRNPNMVRWGLTRIEKAIFLRSVDLFSHTTTQELTRVAQIAHETRFLKGATIFKKDSTGDALFLVVDGCVGLYRTGRAMEIVGVKEAVGAWDLFDDHPRGEQAVALEDTVALRLDRSDLFDLMDAHPEIARGLLKRMVRLIRRLTDLMH